MREWGGGCYSGGGGVGATPCHPCMESLSPGIRMMHHGITLRKSRGYSTSKMGLIGLTGGSAKPRGRCDTSGVSTLKHNHCTLLNLKEKGGKFIHKEGVK